MLQQNLSLCTCARNSKTVPMKPPKPHYLALWRVVGADVPYAALKQARSAKFRYAAGSSIDPVNTGRPRTVINEQE